MVRIRCNYCGNDYESDTCLVCDKTGEIVRLLERFGLEVDAETLVEIQVIVARDRPADESR